MRLERLEVFESWVTCLAKTAMSSLKESEEHTSPPATPGSRGVHVASSHFSKTRASRGKRGWLQRQQRQIESRNKAQITNRVRERMHFTLDENRVSGLCGDLRLKAAITRLSSNYFKREVEVCTTICQGNKNKNAQINAQKKCNACTKKKNTNTN